MHKFNITLTRKDKYTLFSIIMGTLAGLISLYLCLLFNITIFGVNIHVFISPVIAGFVETYVSKRLTKESSGAISAVVLFVITNIIGWLFPAQPITWNIFTIGGLLLMLQAAIPLTINYIILGILLALSYILGLIGGYIADHFNQTYNKIIELPNTTDISYLNILVLNSAPDIPIKEYKGLIVVELVIPFRRKPRHIVEYFRTPLEDKKTIKHEYYLKAKEQIIQELQKKAQKNNANAIIDIEIEYTNYNTRIPPDMLISAYGTAVIIDDKYL
ncbi:MAG: hypothetical protein BZ134_03790 [Methanosphaera sp. SHI1033]|nr:MAG: hypothetical protein BZ134_03790 [Methanosphaera sp. SHI1033]